MPALNLQTHSNFRLFWTDVNIFNQAVIMASDLDGFRKKTFFSKSGSYLWGIAHYKVDIWLSYTHSTTKVPGISDKAWHGPGSASIYHYWSISNSNLPFRDSFTPPTLSITPTTNMRYTFAKPMVPEGILVKRR